MPRTFDTGSSQPQRTLVRRGAVSLLSGLKRRNGGYLHEVVGFGGVLVDDNNQLDVQGLMKALGRSPSIGVATDERIFKTLAVGGRQSMGDLSLLLFFANQNSRDPLVGRLEADHVAEADPATDPGLDVIMEHALELMHGSYPAAMEGTISQIAIVSERPLVTMAEVVIWVQTYSVKLQTYTGGANWRTPEQLLTSIGWRVTTDASEPLRPAPAVAPTSIDADTDVT